MTRIPLPHPPQVAWPLLFEMNGVKRGSSYGPGWSYFDAGQVVIMRHVGGNETMVQRGMVALLEYLEV